MIEDNILKISGKSEPAKVGGAIASLMKEEYAKVKRNAQIELRAIGAGAVNQAIKSIIVARGYLAPEGMNIYCIPAFGEGIVEGEEKSLIKIIVKTEV